jgi:preprotein translocase subunit SecD
MFDCQPTAGDYLVEVNISMKTYRTVILIIAVLGLAIWINLPNNPGIRFAGIDKSIETHLGLDLVGGVQALLEADLPDDVQIEDSSMDTARTIIENRVNGLGVSEAIVQRAGERRILVELPGETDPQAALDTIQQTGLLEFVDMSMLSNDEAFSLTGTIIQTDLNVSSEGDITEEAFTFHTIMTGVNISNVGVNTNQAGGYQVAFELDNEGSQIFRDFTSANVGRVLAIVLDKQVISTPSIDSPITTGQGVITGRFTLEEANQLAIQLRYGSLPIPLKAVSSQTVGPTLGQDSLQKSLIAGVIGLSIVMIFMALYYRLPGILADLALICYALISFALFRYIPVTLTLPGIAGFVLSIGVAVDANILIFERMKEELRAGRTLSMAIDLGWSRAWSSIRDSNLSTLITCTILFWFGSTFGASIVKGFSVTLAIGVGVSMFTAIIVTRTFLHLVLDRINYKAHVSWFGV